jgi:hypothetical protein
MGNDGKKSHKSFPQDGRKQFDGVFQPSPKKVNESGLNLSELLLITINAL